MPLETHPSDRLAFDRAQVAEPVWNRLRTAAEAIGLDRSTLLHAGPPFDDPHDVTLPILNSACAAAVWEGLADDFDEARKLIGGGELRLAAAQDHGVVVPLAAVVSSSMQLHSVYDAHRGKSLVHTPINGGNGPAMRLGLLSMEVVEHFTWLNDEFAEALSEGIAEGIPLIEIAAASLAAGDDCHGRTPVATRLLVKELLVRSSRGWNERVTSFMDNSPSLFLNLWMAATKCALSAAEGVEGSGLVTAAGGNGQRMGIQVSGIPGVWFTADATPPCGPIGEFGPERALGAIGDSAIVDAFGLGAMAFNLAPEQQRAFAGFLPDDADQRRRCLTLGTHLGFAGIDARFGISARKVTGNGCRPLVSLGILDRQGTAGRIGGGIYQMPLSVFEAAMAEVGARPG